jgi:hypothetical protein
MSYEQDKVRLIRELAEAQTEIRAHYGMKPKAAPLLDGPEAASGEKDETPNS